MLLYPEAMKTVRWFFFFLRCQLSYLALYIFISNCKIHETQQRGYGMYTSLTDNSKKKERKENIPEIFMEERSHRGHGVRLVLCLKSAEESRTDSPDLRRGTF